MSAHTIVCSASMGGQARVGIITKRVYRLRQGKLSAGEPAALVRDPIYLGAGERDRTLILDSDLFALHKPKTDVLLCGNAYAHRGAVRELHTSLTVGPVQKHVLVTGDRQLEVRGGGALSATRPSLFERMPLGWSRAYGGRDATCEPQVHARVSRFSLAAGYPRNRGGKGFFIDRERRRLDGAALPNLSDPDDPIELARLFAAHVEDWLDRPTPAGYGPIDPTTFPRCWHFGMALASSGHERPLREVALGAISAHDAGRLDVWRRPAARACQCAPAGLATHQLHGSERVELWHLHREVDHFVCELNGERPLLWLEPPHARGLELEPRLTTIFIEPDDDRITLTWAGSVPTRIRYPRETCANMSFEVRWG